MSKHRIISKGIVKNVVNEKRVLEDLAPLKSSFLNNLVRVAQDRDNVYMLLEPALGGDLFDVAKCFHDRYGTGT